MYYNKGVIKEEYIMKITISEKNSINISTTNSKLGGTIPSFNLPAGLTCRADAPCQKGCYAKKGNWVYSNVKQSVTDNLKAFIEEPENFFNAIINHLNNSDICYKFFRWHSSGDIVNNEYLKGIIRVAESCPQTKFLCFTKKFHLVNLYIEFGGKIPKNLKIVFSAWDKNFKVDNPYNLPVTYVYFKDESRNADIPEFAIPCIGKCYECKACWSLEKGQSVVFHQH